MPLKRLVVLATAVALSACAGSSEHPDASLATAAASRPPTPVSAAAIPPAAAGYKLTAAEEKLDCPKLTGQMKVRIANMRANVAQGSGTNTSRAIQSVATPVFGGTTRGLDPAADLAMDRAKLEAFNKRLAERKCKTLDLDAELRGEAPPATAPAKASPRAAARTG
jgi:hypothetical protein